MDNQRARYRPSFTASEIATIISLCASRTQEANCLAILGKLATISSRIAVGDDKPAYIADPPISKPSIYKQLGMPEPQLPALINVVGNKYEDINPDLYKAKENYWLACYHKYIEQTQDCSPNEILAAQEHKYLNDLMTPEEEVAFEAAQHTEDTPHED